MVSEGLFLAELGKSYTCKKTTAEISTKSKKKQGAVFLQLLSCNLQKTKKNMAFPTTKRTYIKLGPQETNCTFWPLNCKALRAHLRCWGKLGDFHGGSPISRIGFSSSPGFWRMIISMSWMPLVRRSSTSFFPTTSKKMWAIYCVISSPHKRVHNVAIKGTAHLGTHQTDHDQRPGPFKRGDSTREFDP